MSLRIAARGKLKLGKKDSNVVGPCKKMTKPRKNNLCSTSSPKFYLKNEYLVYLEVYQALNSSFYSSDDIAIFVLNDYYFRPPSITAHYL